MQQLQIKKNMRTEIMNVDDVPDVDKTRKERMANDGLYKRIGNISIIQDFKRSLNNSNQRNVDNYGNYVEHMLAMLCT